MWSLQQDAASLRRPRSIETSLQPSCRRKGFSHDAPVIAILGTSKIPLNNMEQSGERPHNC